MKGMEDLPYHGDPATWKPELLQRAREVYASKLTIEHFIMHCAFQSFEGKNSQVQSMIAVDINSDEVVGPSMKLASKYSGFLSTLNAGKPSGKVNSAIVCSHCNKPGHNDKECYTKHPHLNPRRNPTKGKGDKGKDGKGNPNPNGKNGKGKGAPLGL